MLSGKFGVNIVNCKDQILLREMLLAQSPCFLLPKCVFKSGK